MPTRDNIDTINITLMFLFCSLGKYIYNNLGVGYFLHNVELSYGKICQTNLKTEMKVEVT